MTNTTISTSAFANFDINAIVNLLNNSKATVIIINNDNNNVIDTTATDATTTEVVKRGHAFDHHKYYMGRLKGVLARHDIKIKTGKGGVKKGYISTSAFEELVRQLEKRETTLARIKFLFNALEGAGYKEEGRGLKNDIIFNLLEYIKENDLATTNPNGTYNKNVQYELDNLVDKLVKIPLTNEFVKKFKDCLKEDEVAYATFKLVETA